MGAGIIQFETNTLIAAGVANQVAQQIQTLYRNISLPWNNAIAGTENWGAPKQGAVIKNATTGDTALDLTALATINSGTLNFGFMRFIIFHVPAKLSTGADAPAGCKLTIGAASSNPFLGQLGGTTPTITCEKGGFAIFCCRPFGAGLATTNPNLKVAQGSDTFDWCAGFFGY